MALSLSGKTVLITGSTDGLGKALATKLLEQHAHVIIHGRSQEKIDQTINELRELYPTHVIHSLLCDLTDTDAVKREFSTIKTLDILVNNAGVWLDGATTDASLEKIEELTRTNILGPLLITRILLPILLRSDFAQVINIVSIAGVEIPSGYYHTIYSATKFGMQGFTEGLAKEFYNKNLRIMGYYPGGMQTNLFKKAGNNYKTHEPWMFSTDESVEAILFMLTRNKKVAIKRMDLINQLEE